jgi:large subunit ribosomal protein L28
VNVQHRHMAIDGVMRNVYICTRCMRTMLKVPKVR